MLDRFLLTAGETWRLINRNRDYILLQLFTSILTLLVIALLVVIIINMNYLLEVFESGDLSWNILRPFLPVIDNWNLFRVGSCLLLGAALSLLLYLALYYHRFYLESYRREADLIFKLNGENGLILKPLLLMSVIICWSEVIAAWLLSGLIYSFFSRQIVEQYLHIAVLGFSHFKISLLIVLGLSCAGATLLSVYFLCWRQINRLKDGL